MRGFTLRTPNRIICLFFEVSSVQSVQGYPWFSFIFTPNPMNPRSRPNAAKRSPHLSVPISARFCDRPNEGPERTDRSGPEAPPSGHGPQRRTSALRPGRGSRGWGAWRTRSRFGPRVGPRVGPASKREDRKHPPRTSRHEREGV